MQNMHEKGSHMGDRMRKHDARMIIQRIIGRTFRGTRKAFKAKKLETKRKDHPQHHLYWCKREPINQRRKIEIEFWTRWYLRLNYEEFWEQVENESHAKGKAPELPS